MRMERGRRSQASSIDSIERLGTPLKKNIDALELGSKLTARKFVAIVLSFLLAFSLINVTALAGIAEAETPSSAQDVITESGADASTSESGKTDGESDQVVSGPSTDLPMGAPSSETAPAQPSSTPVESPTVVDEVETHAQQQLSIRSYMTTNYIAGHDLNVVATGEAVSPNGAPVSGIAKPTINAKDFSGTDSQFTFWQARALPKGDTQWDNRYISSSQAGKGKTTVGSEIDRLRYASGKWQYKAVGSGSWIDASTAGEIVFYYRQVVLLGENKNIRVDIADWFLSSASSKNAAAVLYQVYDQNDKPVGNAFKTFYGGKFDVKPILVGVQSEDWVTSDVRIAFQNSAMIDKGITDYVVPTFSSMNRCGTENGRFIAYPSLKTNNSNVAVIGIKIAPAERSENQLKVQYLDSVSGQSIQGAFITHASVLGSVKPTWTNFVNVVSSGDGGYVADKATGSKLADSATVTTAFGAQHVPLKLASVPEGYVSADYVRAELADDGKTLNLYFEPKVVPPVPEPEPEFPEVVEPEAPEPTPEPEQPETPDSGTPEVPETPEEPALPETPENPAPTTPEPENPTEPATPAEPTAPEAPVAPLIPAAPVEIGGGAAAIAQQAIEETLGDEVTPLADPESIQEDGNPLSTFDHHEEECWVHILMILGMILSVVYGAAVTIRRENLTRTLRKDEESLIEDETVASSSATEPTAA